MYLHHRTSAVGKTTYAQKHYPDIPIIDSDSMETTDGTLQAYDRKTILSHLFHAIHEQATVSDAVVVHRCNTIAHTLQTSDVTIVLVVTPFKRLTPWSHVKIDPPIRYYRTHSYRPIISNRPNPNVNTGGRCSRNGPMSKHYRHLPKDTRAIRTFIETVSTKRKVRLQPRMDVEYDVFVIV